MIQMADGNTIANIAHANLGRMYNSVNSAGGTGYYSSVTGQPWCADFAKWCWAQAGADVSGLDPGAVSFAQYGALGATPQVGDAVVFGVNGSKTYAQHVALVVAVDGGNIMSIGGDEGSGSPTQNQVGQDGWYSSALGPSSYWGEGFPISGYVSPKGLVTAQPSPGSWLVAFQDGSNQLWLRNSAGDNNETGLAMAPGTSSSLAGQPDGSWLVAFQDRNNQLGLRNSAGGNNGTGLAMAPGTSPSLAGQPDGSWLVAFQDRSNQLWLRNSAGDNNETGLAMAPGTSPSLAGQPDGSWLVAFQDRNNQLWLRNSAGGNNETGLAMELSAPSLSSA
jgi:hypothetical protein